MKIKRIWKYGNIKCSVKNCKNIASSKFLCEQHYHRKLRGGDLSQPFRKMGEGSINLDGYRRIYVSGKYVLEHRLVYEKHTGIKLSRNQVIHHKNHNKLDNRFENLELMELGSHNKHHNPLIAGTKKCKIVNCGKQNICKDLCRRHYYALRKFGDPLHPLSKYPGDKRMCSVKGCPNRYCALGFCQAHYTREQRRLAGRKPKPWRRTLP